MKIAFVTRFPRDPDRPRGGVEAVSVTLVRALSALSDLELEVVTTEPGQSSVEHDVVDGVRVHRLPGPDRGLLADAVGPGRRRMHHFLGTLGPDVVHAHDIYGIMVKGLRIPRVFTVHGFIHADTRVGGGRFARLRSWLWRRYEVAAWVDQPHIISISPYVRERLSRLVPARIHDVENPVSEAFFAGECCEVPGTVFSAATVEPRKNTMVLVEAVGRLVEAGRDVRLRLAGAIIDVAYGRQVESALRSLGAPRASMLGAIPGSRVREELSRASVFALISLEENAPMGIEEAMATGVPVVASNRCGMPYLVRDGVSGYLVDPLDVADVAERLDRILSDKPLRREMGIRGRAIALDRFRAEGVALRTRDVYRIAVGKHP